MQTHRLRYFRRLRLFLIAGVIAAATAAAQESSTAPPPEKYPLRAASAVGDLSEEEASMNMDLPIEATAGGRKVPPLSFFRRERLKYREAVLALDKNGRPSAVRRAYTTARHFEITPDGQSRQTASSLQGKTVTIRRTGDKIAVTIARGEISAKDRQGLTDDLGVSLADRFFPDRDLAPGDEWKLESKEVARGFTGAQKAVVTGKFLEVVPFAGHRCARVQMTINVSGKLPNAPINMEMELSGDLYHALDIQRTLSVSLTGPIKAKGKDHKQGVAVDFSGEGTMDTKWTARWLKVGDKPVPVSR